MTSSTYVILAFGGVLALCIAVASVLRRALPGILVRMARLDTLEPLVHALQTEAAEREREVHDLTTQRNNLSYDLTRVEREAQRLEREADRAAQRMPLFVHEIGEPGPGMFKFTLKLTRETSRVNKAQDGSQAANPIWHHQNCAEVWARNADEARQMAELSFPTKLGFTKFLVQSQTPGESR